ncbi:unnamed protein product, partial [Linum tenue]
SKNIPQPKNPISSPSVSSICPIVPLPNIFQSSSSSCILFLPVSRFKHFPSSPPTIASRFLLSVAASSFDATAVTAIVILPRGFPRFFPAIACGLLGRSCCEKERCEREACVSSSLSGAMQSQLMCNGCRSILLYPRGASNVCCALCNTITSVPSPGMEMAQLICGGCRTLLMYTRGATSVRCSCCHTVNLAPVSSQVAHINCGNCRTTLMYPYGAPSVKCAVCQYVTNVSVTNVRVQPPVNRPNGTGATVPSTTSAMPHSQTQTVVVENPMSVDESGKLVSNVVVGVTTDKK